jgi:hypothetical protein
MNWKEILKTLIFKRIDMETPKGNYWMSIAYFGACALIIGIWGYTSVNIALLFANGAWTPAVADTYNAVSFLTMETGIGFITAIILIPIMVLAFAYYVWHLSARIKKLEALTAKSSETVSKGES